VQAYDDSATTMEPTTEAPAAPGPQKPAKWPAAPPEYQMPPVRLNQRIIWRPDPTEEGMLPGLAIKLGPNTISVLVFVEGSGAPVQIREGARHITDKRWSRDAGEGGVWDYDDSDRELYGALEELANAFHAQDILLNGLTHTVAELRAKVAELETKPCTWATAEQLAEQQKRIDALSMASNPMPISEALRPAPEPMPEPAQAQPIGPPAPTPKHPKK
jgi:hypothetical protein